MKQFFFILLGFLYFTSPCLASDSAVILMYHRFGESDFPSTNTRIAQLEDHIRVLTAGPYNVMPVLQIVSRIKRGDSLPEKTVGITVDDGFRSIYTEAWPRFSKAHLPFTIFVATDPIENSNSGYLDWDQIREMRRSGVTFGAHTASHIHLVDASRKEIEAEIQRSNDRFTNELGEPPKLFAYPFGETSKEVIHAVSVGRYQYAFGQHSGVVNRSSSFRYLPRFALNEKYGRLNRFKLVINTLPIPVFGFTPADSIIKMVNPPHIGFTVMTDLKHLSRISCFTTSEGRVSSTLLGTSRIEVRMTKPFFKRRTRLNCTLPGVDGRWHWLGALFVLPKP